MFRDEAYKKRKREEIQKKESHKVDQMKTKRKTATSIFLFVASGFDINYTLLESNLILKKIMIKFIYKNNSHCKQVTWEAGIINKTQSKFWGLVLM